MNEKTCVYKITVPSGHQIELNIKNFTLEEVFNCRFDRLEIRNGGLETSPLIGTFCGTQYPKTLRSMSNQMLLTFVSDASRNDIGFDIEWVATQTGCGGLLTSYRGTITTPNYPEPYDKSAMCSWRIAVNQGYKIQMIFSDFDLEQDPACLYDYVEIFDGKDASAHSLGRHCDSEKHPLSVHTSSNYAFIRFKSDNSNQGRGFSLRYTSICNMTLTGLNGAIESPNFPNNYPSNFNCEWMIEGLRGSQIYVEFTHFDLEASSEYLSSPDERTVRCNYDYVEIVQYEKNETVGSEKYCNKKPDPFTSSGNSILVRFASDSSTQATGFRFEWSVEGCSGILTKPEGTINSPGYPEKYKHGVECLWIIQAQYGETIQLTVHDLNIEYSRGCGFDGLRIRSLDEDVATMCHMDNKANIFISHGHEMEVKFYADESVSYKGFSASYKVLKSSKYQNKELLRRIA